MAYLQQNHDDEENQKRALEGQEATNPGAAPSAAPQGSPGQPQSYTQSSFASGRKILKKNQNKEAPNLVNDFTARFGKQKEDASQGFQKYQQQVTDTVNGSKVANNDYNQALTGQGPAFERINGLLNGGGNNVSAYTPYQSNANIADINALNSSAGVESALKNQAQKQGNYSYGQGSAALDAQLFNRNGGRSQVLEASNQKGALDSYLKGLQDQAGETGTKATADINKNVNDLRNRYQDQASGITQAAQQRAGALNLVNPRERNPQYEDQKNEILNRTLEKYKSLVGKSKPAMDAIKNYISQNDLDVDKYIKAGSLQGPAYSADQALQFNNIQNLLGRGDRASANDQIVDNFDANRYGEDLDKLAAKGVSSYEHAGAEAKRQAILNDKAPKPGEVAGENYGSLSTLNPDYLKAVIGDPNQKKPSAKANKAVAKQVKASEKKTGLTKAKQAQIDKEMEQMFGRN